MTHWLYIYFLLLSFLYIRCYLKSNLFYFPLFIEYRRQGNYPTDCFIFIIWGILVLLCKYCSKITNIVCDCKGIQKNMSSAWNFSLLVEMMRTHGYKGGRTPPLRLLVPQRGTVFCLRCFEIYYLWFFVLYCDELVVLPVSRALCFAFS